MFSDLSQSLQKYASKWGVTIERQIGTCSGLIGFGKQGNLSVVLKLLSPNSDELQQEEILQCFKGNGAARILNFDGTALLLERLCPGLHLFNLTKKSRDEEATHIFCQTARQLHLADERPGNIQPIAMLAAGFDRYLNRKTKVFLLQQLSRPENYIFP